jgi:hypothetical protein
LSSKSRRKFIVKKNEISHLEAFARKIVPGLQDLQIFQKRNFSEKAPPLPDD